eukprot:m.142355 g.142355  ORF g.142355 m.142355 type:complete len:65 (+) comp38359_c0_seq1:206-400(+)
MCHTHLTVTEDVKKGVSLYLFQSQDSKDYNLSLLASPESQKRDRLFSFSPIEKVLSRGTSSTSL